MDAVEGNRADVQRRRDRMVKRLSAMGFAAFRPEGGWFLLADTRPLGIPASIGCMAYSVRKYTGASPACQS